MLSSVDLPEPEGPEQHDQLALEQVEVDAAQRVHLDLAHAIDLREAARAQHGDRLGGRGRLRHASGV